ncbi:helix-turn-helix domain-containing protein [Microvirga makkahensis]|uniref:helix-turn-helix domain-containing protein n=1 Tax=Microvirga makkahensis TaxID=1128670 RepID=UPI003CCD6134
MRGRDRPGGGFSRQRLSRERRQGASYRGQWRRRNRLIPPPFASHSASTPRLGRAELIRRVIEHGQSAGEIARDSGISERTARKWLARLSP